MKAVCKRKGIEIIEGSMMLNWIHCMPGIFDTSLLQKGWQIAVDSSVPTCRLFNKPYDGKSNTLYVIDGFLLSPNIELTSVETLELDFEFSDHNPVRVTAKLK